jgi:hypothetical protein
MDETCLPRPGSSTLIRRVQSSLNGPSQGVYLFKAWALFHECVA